MAKVIANLTLDTYKRNRIPPLIVPQGDYGVREVHARITSNGNFVKIEETNVVSIVATRTVDENSLEFLGTINDDGSVNVPITQWMLTYEGEVKCSISVTMPDGQVTTNDFIIDVQFNPNTTEISPDDPQRDIIAEVIANENIRVNNEIQRMAAEEHRAEKYSYWDAEIRTKADGIKCTAYGDNITIKDSSDDPFRGLKIYGKTTQNGIPAPNAPISLENVGDGGVVARVGGAQCIPFSENGSTTQNGITATFEDGKITLSGTSTANVWLTAFTMTLDAGEYTLSSDFIPAGVTVYIFSYAEYFSISSGALTKTKTFSQGSYNFVIETGTNVTLNDEFRVMLNKGSTALPYQPYSQQQIITTIPNGICGIPVTSGGNYTDANDQQWICDEIDLERGVLIKRTHTITFVGTEPLSQLGNVGDANAFFYLIDSSIKPYVVENEGFSLSSHFEAKRIMSSTTDIGHQVRKTSAGEQYRVLFRPNNVSGMTAAQFQTWLESNPTTVTYALATATEIPLSAEDIEAFKSVHTNYPVTVITSEGYMEAKYNADTKTYIDNKFAELAAQIINNV